MVLIWPHHRCDMVAQSSKIDSSDRKGFSVTAFAGKYDLGDPVAVNWFTVAAPSATSEER